MLWTSAIKTVGKKYGEACLPQPLCFRRRDEVVKDNLYGTEQGTQYLPLSEQLPCLPELH